MPPKDGSSRDLLLEAARQEFAEHGFTGARVARIAARAGRNKQLIFYYFGSKAGLYQAVTEQAAAVPSLPREATPAPATARLRAALEATFQALADRPELVRALVVSGAGRDDGARQAAWRGLARLENDLAGVIAEGQGLGFFRDDADPRVMARQGIALCLAYLAMEPRPAAAARASWVAASADTLVRALGW